MARAERLELVRAIEESRGSAVLVYVVSDRQASAGRMADDVIRPIYDHVRRISQRSCFQNGTKKLDLFLYSLGGTVDAPWRIMSMLREMADEVNVLIAANARSAATLLALGADEIVMGPKAELGPIDPRLERRGQGDEGGVAPREIAVEDVRAYVAFCKEAAGLSDQDALQSALLALTEEVSPVVLGSVQRQYAHVPTVAKKLLDSRRERTEEDRAELIIESLTQKTYSHGHALSRSEAKELGLQVVEPPEAMADLMWNLYEDYEAALRMRVPYWPLDALRAAGKDEIERPNCILACIESTELLSVYEATFLLHAQRQPVPQVAVNINVPIQLPEGVAPNEVPQHVQALLANLRQAVVEAAQRAVREAVEAQAPIVDVRGTPLRGMWREAEDFQVTD